MMTTRFFLKCVFALKIENVDDFRNIIEAVVQGQPRIEFGSDNKNVMICVLERLTNLQPVRKEHSCNRVDGSWTSILNGTFKSNNKIISFVYTK